MRRARKVSRMRRPFGIQEVADSILGPATYIGHEIFYGILSIPLIQVAQLLVTGESMGT